VLALLALLALLAVLTVLAVLAVLALGLPATAVAASLPAVGPPAVGGAVPWLLRLTLLVGEVRHAAAMLAWLLVGDAAPSTPGRS